ncbi:hypothetical protein AHF37_06404 [Paragonimus kellicotti]|nr:hypothetical protein AHF37_06404 [Paragonimus kellicotti]
MSKLPPNNHLMSVWCAGRCRNCCFREKAYRARVVNLGHPSKTQHFPSNKINNQKYSILSFFPLVRRILH